MVFRIQSSILTVNIVQWFVGSKYKKKRRDRDKGIKGRFKNEKTYQRVRLIGASFLWSRLRLVYD